MFWQVLSLTGGWTAHDEEEEPLGDEDDDDEDKDKVHNIILTSTWSVMSDSLILQDSSDDWFLSYLMMLKMVSS